MMILVVWLVSSLVGIAAGEFIYRVLLQRRAIKTYGGWVKGWFK